MSAKDTIARVKDVLCNTILNGDKLAEEVRLYIQKPQGGYTLLEDALQVEKAGLENDMLVYLTYYDQDQGERYMRHEYRLNKAMGTISEAN